jgi:son of sevenless-like protein
MMEIVSGLRSAAIHRMKQTWGILPPKSREIFNSLVADLDSESNFSKYRDLLHKSAPPIVPYLGTLNKTSFSHFVRNVPNGSCFYL